LGLIDELHAFGPMNDVMEVVHIADKGGLLDTLEKFYIYIETQNGNQIIDKLTVQRNPIFEALV
jgi:phage terminase large subunit-like protein